MKKKGIGISIIIGLLIALALAIVFIGSKESNEQLTKLDAETLRAMEYDELTELDKKVDNCDYIQFSAFFTRDLDRDGYAERLKGTCNDIENAEDTLYLELNVLGKGSFTNGMITFNSGNYYWKTALADDTVIDGNYMGIVSEVKLKDVNNGTQKLFLGKIAPHIVNVSDYSFTNTVTLTGTYITEDGTEIYIEKNSDIIIDWYGRTETEVNRQYHDLNTYYDIQNQTNSILNAVTDTEVVTNFRIAISETNKNLILQKQSAEVEIQKLNGYSPTEVTVITTNVEYNYDEESRILTFSREATVDENGKVTKSVARNNIYYIKVTYPLEAYSGQTAFLLNIPYTAYNYGFNNPNEEFDNPYVSSKDSIITVSYSHLTGDGFVSYSYIGEWYNYNMHVMKTNPIKLYNNQEANSDIYNTEWTIHTGKGVVGDSTITSVVMKETDEHYGDELLKSDGSYVSIGDYTSNLGIYFYGSKTTIDDDGYIKLYNDETDELIYTFTKDNLLTYTSYNPYMYDEPIKHIRIETSHINTQSSLYIYHIKELDSEKIVDTFSREEFDSFQYIYTYLTSTANYISGAQGTVNSLNYAYYEEEKSEIEITLNHEEITNQEVAQNYQIVLKTVTDNSGQAKWKNGEFLIKFPEQIKNISVKNISIDNPNVNIIGYDVYKDGENYFLKIITENEDETSFNIFINCDLYPNPLERTANTYLEIYSYNENCSNYVGYSSDRYDINGNGNTAESVGYQTQSIYIVAPSTLVSSEVITDYDIENNITYAPNIAKIRKEQRNANVNVVLKNYYSSTISEVKVLGEVPFTGNRFIITGEDLGSEFNVYMGEGGLVVPDELKNIVKVYYTENPEATKDLEDENNGWTLEPEDWQKVRRYLIDFGEYKIPKDADYTFKYEAIIPEEIDYDKVSYATHAIYFALDTENGKLTTQMEPNRVGLQIARLFKLDLTKYKINTDNIVSGATYKLQEFDENNTLLENRLGTTDVYGNFVIDNLNINRKYKLEEIKAPSDFSISEDEIEFEVKENDNGELVINIISEDNFKSVPIIQNPDNSKEVIKVEVEDYPKFRLNLTKLENGTGEKLENVRFKILETKREYKTDVEGNLEIPNLEMNKEYTLKEYRSDGYYLLDEIKFKLILDSNNEYKVISDNTELTNGAVDNSNTEPVVYITLENEKIPTYNLEILKVEEGDDNNTGLRDARYQIKSTDTSKVNTYTTNEEGKAQINDLYRYIAGKNVTGEYTLQEIKAPIGYANNSEKIVFKVSEENGELNLIIEDEDNLTSVKSYEIEGNTVRIILQDRPLFKLTKTGDNNEPLANVKFKIYSTTVGGEIIDFAKDVNGEWIGELNEKDEYVVKTDSNGEIKLALPPGYYKAIEVEAPEGYDLAENEEDRAHYFKTEGIVPDLIINSIEDLVRFSNDVNSGNTYENKLVLLNRSLDFLEDSSYDDPNDTTSFGDYNEDGAVQGIKAELNKAWTSGSLEVAGFRTIGTLGPHIVSKTRQDEDSNEVRVFKGSFDGNGNEIRNLYMVDYRSGDTTKSAAFFGNVENANIANINFVRTSSNTKQYDVSSNVIAAGVVYSAKNSKLFNISTNIKVGTLNNGGHVAGIAYEAIDTKISNCIHNGEIYTQPACAGGIVYKTNGVEVFNCTNNGKVSATGYIGGICGLNENNSKFLNCVNNGQITCSTSGGGYASGIVGYSTGSAEVGYCKNFSNIETPMAIVSGIIGGNYSFTSDTPEIKIYKCMNSGDLICTGKNCGYYSGIASASVTEVTDCYNTGNIRGEIADLLGIVLHCKGKVENCYNTGNITYSRISVTYGGYVGGIAYYADEVQNCYNTGNLYGQSYSGGISALGRKNASSTEYSIIKDCYNAGNVQTTQAPSGGIVGDSGRCINCYNLGNIDSPALAGGIIGYSAFEITNCYNEGNIGQSSYPSPVGGLAGCSTGNSIIQNSYNKGSVRGSTNVGGIVGAYGGSGSTEIKNVYNIGEVVATNSSPNVGSINGMKKYINLTNCYYINDGKKPTGDGDYSMDGAIPMNLSDFNSLEFLSTLNSNKDLLQLETETKLLNWISDSKGYPSFNLDYIDFDIEIESLDTMQDSESTEIKELSIANSLKQFDITTEIAINSDNVRTGGSITGSYNESYVSSENKRFVETKKYGESNSTPIIITPEENYKIAQITVNGEAIEFKPDENGIVTLNANYFENLDENKHIIVTFEKGISNVIVHHYLKAADGTYTYNKVAKDQYLYGKIGTDYTTEPYIDLDKLSLEKDNDEKYVMPTNAKGKFDSSLTEVNYYYEAEKIKLTIHHYLEGTETPIKPDEEIFTDSKVEFDVDGNYIVLSNSKYKLNENSKYNEIISGEYKLESILSTIKPEVEITDELEYSEDSEIVYYYSLNTYDITTKIQKHEENSYNELTQETTKVQVEGGTITGRYTVDYAEESEIRFVESVEFESDAKTQIVIKPDDLHSVKTIKVISEKENETKIEKVLYGENAEETEITYTENNGEFTLSNFENVKANKQIVVEFEQLPSKVVVHYEMVDGSKIKNSNGEDIEDKEYKGFVGDFYNVETSGDAASIYHVETISRNPSGRYTKEQTDIYYYYDYNSYSYTIEHYYQDKESREYKLEKSEVRDPIKYGTIKLISADDHVIEPGYEVDRIEGDGLTITENENSNVIKIYYGLADYTYTVEYYFEDYYTHEYNKEDIDTSEDEYKTSIVSYIDKTKTGYVENKEKRENYPLEVSNDSTKNVIKIYYDLVEYNYDVKYYLDDVHQDDLDYSGKAKYKSVITEYTNKLKDGWVFQDVTPRGDGDNANLEITEKEDENIIKVYYASEYKIIPEIAKHDEKYSDGSSKTAEGGSIIGETEKVLKGNDSTKSIKFKPDEGYVLVKVTINDDEEYVFTENDLAEDGSLTIPVGYFEDVQEDKHVKAEFRKSSKVIVKYLDEDTEDVLETEETILGYEGKTFDAPKKSVKHYLASNLGLTDLDKNPAVNTMFADEYTVVYWYTRIPEGVLVKYIEVTEEDLKDGLDIDEGSVIEESFIHKTSSEKETTNRNNYENYISIDGPLGEFENIIIASKDENTKEAEYLEDTVVEVRYYYERQFNITTEVKPHKELVDGVEQDVNGGNISKEYELDEEGNLTDVEITYEVVLKLGENSKEIEITPDEYYRVKSIYINDVIVSNFKEDENHKVVIEAGYFKDIDKDIHILVEFEKIPTNVIVKFVDIDTLEEVSDRKIINGVINDSYETERIEIENYIPAEEEPENKSGEMTEDDIEVIYYYKRQFRITTTIIEHSELQHEYIEIPKDGNQLENVVTVKGGNISGEAEKPYEVVLRGNSNTKEIIIKPDEGYQIVMLRINKTEQKIDDPKAEIKLDMFDDIQEDKDIEVQFERERVILTVKYLEDGTEKVLADEEKITGGFNELYITHEKLIDGYKVLGIPENAKGTLIKNTDVKYYYKKLLDESSTIFENGGQISDTVVENRTIVSDNSNYTNVANSIKTGDNIVQYVIILALAEVCLVIVILKKYNK